jgi:hypothetical protein
LSGVTFYCYLILTHHSGESKLLGSPICYFYVVMVKLNATLINAVTATLLNFVRLFRKAHEENCKQVELEKKKAEKEAEMEKAKGINLTRRTAK